MSGAAGDLDAAVAAAVDALAAARSLMVVTGAGVSADSGLPTYRGVGGLYEEADTPEGIPIEEALSGRMLREDPALCWRHVLEVERAGRGARPNPAHEAIAWLERRVPRTWVLTQNVDGLHRRAGSRNLIEIHGDLSRLACTACAWETRVADYAGLACPPRCPACGGLVRPGVVLFGEALPPAAVRRLVAELERGFDVVMVVGTTAVFPYVAEPAWRARAAGGTVIEVNPGRSEVSDLAHVRLPVGAARALSAIRAAWEARDPR